MFGRTETALALVLALGLPGGVAAQGVPTADAQQIAGGEMAAEQELERQAQNVEENANRAEIAAQTDAQLAALDQTLELLTRTSAFVPGLEDGSAAGAQYASAEVYAIDDNNPYAGRLFGDTRETIEQMIVDAAAASAGHPALSAASINPTEWRCWLQALVKQESNFSIGAKSPAAAFGLTQIIPGTAQELGIYPGYYDDPRLQLEGGARYLLTQLARFGSMPLALAAYNAGPGAVIRYNGIPPYKETQNYVVRISGFYNTYAARMSGADTVGTLDPKDMVIAEASNIADAGWHYGAASSDTMAAAATRLQAIVAQVDTSTSVKTSMDLNTYARAEVARMAAIVTRLEAAQRQVEAARYALLLEAYAEDETYLRVELER